MSVPMSRLHVTCTVSTYMFMLHASALARVSFPCPVFMLHEHDNEHEHEHKNNYKNEQKNDKK
jgi:hypothetical protein